MKIDWFYLNSLAEANVTDMCCMFSVSKLNQDISIQANEPWRVRKWDISNVEDMSYMFNNSNLNQNLGAWDLSNKETKQIFLNSEYSIEKYEIDRKNYLHNIELEKQKLEKENNDKYLLKANEEINTELNKDIEISEIELEF